MRKSKVPVLGELEKDPEDKKQERRRLKNLSARKRMPKVVIAEV